MSWLGKLFSDSSNVSMMRLMSFMSLLIGAYLALEGKDTSVAIFVGSAFAGKIWQKSIEVKGDSRIEEETKS